MHIITGGQTGELSMNSVMDFDFEKEQQLKGLKLFSKRFITFKCSTTTTTTYYYYYYLY